jgi:hypothetical protein
MRVGVPKVAPPLLLVSEIDRGASGVACFWNEEDDLIAYEFRCSSPLEIWSLKLISEVPALRTAGSPVTRESPGGRSASIIRVGHE